ncbi:hypothetical protein [Pseudoxanthomonas sp. SE1]|uniref:hypothetical protein n=1 Tax=Pseudoxanthomonas sp. SE1 TaxID=1664560 RepID=UPI00240CE770|nr:hypothetical protein [Pseudoxanthomonas sp. SE1]WFC42290.1 hypothetical protein OY559_01740 [Pseudoxanthomonas sp. SE1]
MRSSDNGDQFDWRRWSAPVKTVCSWLAIRKDLVIAKIEPDGRGLAVRFVADGVDDPGRPVTVPSVPRGKTFVQNWILPRQIQVIASCRLAQMMEHMPGIGPGVVPSHPENTASL